MSFETIDRAELQRKLSQGRVDNSDPSAGLALVNVLSADMFERKHIPSSINIPVEEINRFDERFDKEKDIVVYCASTDCDASPRAAKQLADRGFRNVFDYEGGMADWEQANQPVAGRESVPSETPP